MTQQFPGQFPGQFHGQQAAPQGAPVPQAGGFPAPVQAQVPAGQPAYQQPVPPQQYQAPVAQPQYQQAAPAPVAQPQYQQAPQGAPPAAPTLPAHLTQALKGAAMGSGYRKQLPGPADYTVRVEDCELTQIGPDKGRKQWVLFVNVVVESSTHPTAQAGFRGKVTRFLESDYDNDGAVAEVKRVVGACLGYDSAEALDSAMPDWPERLAADRNVLAGGRLSISVKHQLNKDKTVKLGKDGQPKFRDDVARA